MEEDYVSESVRGCLCDHVTQVESTSEGTMQPQLSCTLPYMYSLLSWYQLASRSEQDSNKSRR